MVHGGRTGVIRLTRDRDLLPADALHASHGPDGGAHRLQHRPLLDVGFQEGKHSLRRLPGILDTARIAAERNQRLAQCDAITVNRIENAGIKRSGNCFGTAKRYRKPDPLFIPKRNNFHGKGAAFASSIEFLDCDHGGKNAKRAIVPSRIAHRIDV